MAAFTDHLPCAPYVTPAEVLACCPAATDAGILPNDPRLLEAIEDASLILYYLTGRQFDGTCTETIRPCVPCGCQGGGCCCEVNSIDLGLWPITNIVSVWYDGAFQPLTDFHVDEYHLLVRSNDQDPWPTCSNLWAERGGPHDNLTEGFVWEIEVEVGIPVPRPLVRAARDLACALLSASCLGDTCRLPERVTSLSRRGVTMDIGNPLDYLDRGMTGIYSVDLAIKTLNPTRLQSPSFVWSPNLRRNANHRTYT